MGERLDRTQEVGGSSPPSSIVATRTILGSRRDNWEAAGDGAAEMRDRYDGGWDIVLAPFVERAR